MKAVNFRILVIATMLVAMTAQGATPSWDKPVAKSSLEELTEPLPEVIWPLPEQLTMNRQDGSPFATSFTLQEDNGLRCVKAPCPNMVRSLFRRTVALPLSGGSIRYLAVEINRPAAQGPNRILEVTDHSEEPGGLTVHTWEVTLRNRLEVRQFGGNPTLLLTPTSR